MDEFRFENTLELTESQYLAIWATLPKWRQSRSVGFVVLVAVGIIFLFTPYTLLLGLILLGAAGVILSAPGIFTFSMVSTFNKHKYLRDALTYGVSDQKLWVKGARLDANVPWSMLVAWHEIEGWLVLSPSGIPPVYLSVARLKNEGLYGRVRALAASNAPEFRTSGPRY